MKIFFTVLFFILLFTSWVWPILLVSSLLEAIKQIKEGENYTRAKWGAIIALIAMAIGPFVISLVVTST